MVASVDFFSLTFRVDCWLSKLTLTIDHVDFFATPGVSYSIFRLDSIFAYFVSKWLKLRSLSPFMLLRMVKIILFGLNLCATSLKVKNYSFISLVRWRNQSRVPLRMKMFSRSVLLNGTVIIIRFLFSYAIPPSHPSIIWLEILMMLALLGICSPNDILPLMVLRNISSQSNRIRSSKTLASLSMISLLVSSSFGTNLISLIHHGILPMMQ